MNHQIIVGVDIGSKDRCAVSICEFRDDAMYVHASGDGATEQEAYTNAVVSLLSGLPWWQRLAMKFRLKAGCVLRENFVRTQGR